MNTENQPQGAKPQPPFPEVHIYRDGATQFRLSIELHPDTIDIVMSPTGPPLDPSRLPAFLRWYDAIVGRFESDPRPQRITRTDTGQRMFIGKVLAVIRPGGDPPPHSANGS
jgi:hypothetical protein